MKLTISTICLKSLLYLVLIANPFWGNSQNLQPVPTKADTLRGSIGNGRLRWNVLKYDITVEPDFNTKSIQGINIITYLDSGITEMQVDLQEPMKIDSIYANGRNFSFTREGNVYWIEELNKTEAGPRKPLTETITIYFSGKPREAVRAPWDGGWIWKKDINGNPWMTVACQGLGASVWYPCKDTQEDEPEQGAGLHIIVPDSLMGIGNGKLASKVTNKKGYTQYNWVISNPINNYCIIPYIGKYAHFNEQYAGLSGLLSLDYYVLEPNIEKAKIQFTEVPSMLKAFEHWFGPYPFYSDGFKLIESPHLGMEHQSAIAYGNAYKKGYLGRDLSNTGWGLKWDFIIIHESGHEWFGNNITTRDIADMWVHEGFTSYSEVLYTDFHYGTKAGNEYLAGIRGNIDNDIPVIGPYGINREGSGDMYTKGANLIHMIRQVMRSDEKFRDLLIEMNKRFYHKVVTTQEIEQFINAYSGINFSPVFDQYLRTIKIPVIEYKIEGNRLSYRWSNTVPGLNLPVKVLIGEKEQWIKPTSNWKKTKLNKTDARQAIQVDKNFYILTKQAD